MNQRPRMVKGTCIIYQCGQSNLRCPDFCVTTCLCRNHLSVVENLRLRNGVSRQRAIEILQCKARETSLNGFEGYWGWCQTETTHKAPKARVLPPCSIQACQLTSRRSDQRWLSGALPMCRDHQRQVLSLMLSHYGRQTGSQVSMTVTVAWQIVNTNASKDSQNGRPVQSRTAIRRGSRLPDGYSTSDPVIPYFSGL